MARQRREDGVSGVLQGLRVFLFHRNRHHHAETTAIFHVRVRGLSGLQGPRAVIPASDDRVLGITGQHGGLGKHGPARWRSDGCGECQWSGIYRAHGHPIPPLSDSGECEGQAPLCLSAAAACLHADFDRLTIGNGRSPRDRATRVVEEQSQAGTRRRLQSGSHRRGALPVGRPDGSLHVTRQRTHEKRGDRAVPRRGGPIRFHGWDAQAGVRPRAGDVEGGEL